MPSTILLSDNGASSGSAGLKQTAGNDGVLILQTTTSGGTATNAVYVDTSQNVGVGVTPSAWGSGWTGLQFGPSGSAANSGTGTPVTAISNNAYYNGTNWVYINTAAAAQYQLSTSQHIWRYAVSNSGNITWSEAMRLDASGNLGIGTTSPASGSGGGLTLGTTSSGKSLHLYASTYSGNGLANFYGTDGAVKLQIGTASSTAAFVFGNAGSLLLGGNGSEAARIDSSGNLLVGTTSNTSGRRVNIEMTSGGVGQLGLRDSAATAGKYWTIGPNSSNNLVVYNQGTTGVYITDGGTSWTGTSDERLKTDLQPIENGAAKVASLRAVTGRFKTDDEGVSRAFLIAQDVQDVLPEAVNKQDDELGTLGIQYTDVIPLLVAAIKEQQAIIEQLKARLDAANL